MAKRIVILGLLAFTVFSRADDAKSREAYRKTLYAFFSEKGCVRCHDGEKRFDVSGPAFASNDFDKSYQNVRRYIRFGDIANSWLVKKGGGGHWLNDYGYDCKTNGDEIAAMISAWWEGGEKENVPTPKVTAPARIPADAATGYTKMAWDLSELSGTAGTRFELEVRAVLGTYQVKNPRLHVETGSLELQSLSILVNGKESVWRNRYRQLSKVVNADRLSRATLLTTEVETVPAHELQSDSLALQFTRLEPTEPQEAKKTEAFSRFMGPVLEARHCTHCHHQESKLSWRFDASAEGLATQTLQRLDRKRLEQSPWLTLPARGEAGHPLIFTEDDYPFVLNSLRAWLAEE